MTALPSPARDPLAEVIANYQRGVEDYNSSGLDDDAELDLLAARTFGPWLDRLHDAPPRPTTLQGAIAGLKHLRTVMDQESLGESQDLPLLDAVLAFFTAH